MGGHGRIIFLRYGGGVNEGGGESPGPRRAARAVLRGNVQAGERHERATGAVRRAWLKRYGTGRAVHRARQAAGVLVQYLRRICSTTLRLTGLAM